MAGFAAPAPDALAPPAIREAEITVLQSSVAETALTPGTLCLRFHFMVSWLPSSNV